MSSNASASKPLGLNNQTIGVLISLLSAIVVGWAPILGKMAFHAGVDPYTLAALRTLLAALVLWLFYLIRWRQYIAIGWHNLLGCIGMGTVNGIGSLFYYAGLQKVDASLASLLYTIYPIWVFIFLSASGHEISRLAFLRLGLALVGLYLVTSIGPRQPNGLGVMLMLASAAAYGWHLVLGQWVLADVSSQTVTLYVLTAMAAVVGGVRLASGQSIETISSAAWQAILGLAIVTALSRLLIFAGLRRLGGVQTALLSIMELVTTLLVARIVLHDRLTLTQWIGAATIVSSALLVSREKSTD